MCEWLSNSAAHRTSVEAAFVVARLRTCRLSEPQPGGSESARLGLADETVIGLIERLRGGRRPPTGPLTTSEQAAAEQTAAEESRRGSQAMDREATAHEQEDPTRE